MRRADRAVARRRDQRSGSPARVLGALVVILALLAGITAVFVQVGEKGSGTIENATASDARPSSGSGDDGRASETPAGSGQPIENGGDDVTIAVVGDVTLGSGDG